VEVHDDQVPLVQHVISCDLALTAVAPSKLVTSGHTRPPVDVQWLHTGHVVLGRRSGGTQVDGEHPGARHVSPVTCLTRHRKHLQHPDLHSPAS
jgi:hypothetical protein